tara:strand:- start:1107 stop:1634 length:528 start_codon:yes stop_codon:yes gene_type:complete
MEELDIEWINKFEDQEKVYEKFYPETVKSIKVFSLYVNKECILDKVKESNYDLINENILRKIELIRLIKERKIDDGVNYKLISLIKHNVDLKPGEIKGYVLNNKDYKFIDNLRELRDINFYDTIGMFEDLNSIFLVYYEFNEKLKQNKTKKIYFNHTNHSSHRKTKRKQLKESTA